MLVACLALVLSMGGVSYAATRIGTKDIANSAITSVKIKDGAVNPADLSAGSRAALSVRAYAYVPWDGTVDLDPARSRGFASVTKPATGVYCLTFTDPSLDPATVAPVVTVDWDKSAGANLTAYVSVSAHDCPAGSDLGVRTFSFTAGKPYKPSDTVGFTVLVP
ncbi:hypothetical protein HIDPHFAB_02639 [Nocardioides sp. T2.26MG-1]|nr:hypothetical protein HIDPHFAB_02639 [Nocardioides sp. T2.26MG-1]